MSQRQLKTERASSCHGLRSPQSFVVSKLDPGTLLFAWEVWVLQWKYIKKFHIFWHFDSVCRKLELEKPEDFCNM